jgi:cell division protein FtsW
MNGKQKLLYLPEAHTDFIYAVVAEELGTVGAGAVLLCFGVIFWRGLRAAWLMTGRLRAVSRAGRDDRDCGAGVHQYERGARDDADEGNPCPMISYGGSSLLSTLAMLGI